MTRIAFSGIPISLANSVRTACGICALIQIVIPSDNRSGAARMARPSSGCPASRWLVIRWRTTCAALAKVASTPSVLLRDRKATLSGKLSKIGAALAGMTCSTPTKACSGSQSTRTASAASSATSGVLAITAASASPTCRARSSAKAWRTQSNLSCAPAINPSPETSSGKGPHHCANSGPVTTARTPGRASAAWVSIPRMRAWAYGLRTNATCCIPGKDRLATKRALPVSRYGSSLRLTRAPISEGTDIEGILLLDLDLEDACYSKIHPKAGLEFES